MFSFKKVLPFFLVLLLPLSFALKTAAARKNPVTDPAGVVKTNLYKLVEDRPLYFIPKVYAQIDQISFFENATHKKLKVLKAGSWQYDPKKSEVTFKEPFDDTGCYLIAEGVLEFPFKIKLKDIDYNTLTVLINDNLASEGEDYQVDQANEELVFGKDFKATFNYTVAARRKSVGLFTLSNAIEDYSHPPALLIDEAIRQKIGKVQEYQVKVNQQGEPELFIGEIDYNSSNTTKFYGVMETTQQTDQELSKEMRFPVCFPDSLGVYQLKDKAKSQIYSLLKKTINANYTNGQNEIWVNIEKRPAGFMIDDLARELTGNPHANWVKSNIGNLPILSGKEYMAKSQEYDYFAKPVISVSFYAQFIHNSLLYRFTMYDYVGADGAKQVQECLREYLRQVFGIK
jgi:hypothetical protein